MNPTHSGPITGIDLGTTYSAIAVLNPYGRAEVVADKDGSKITPSVVLFPPNSVKGPLVGLEAKQRSVEHPDAVVEFVKREMGDRDWKRKLGGIQHNPSTVSALILKHLLNQVQFRLGERPRSAVITCPAYFGDFERQATAHAGKLAGLDVLGVINEPTAAALAYGLHHAAKGARLRALVYDLGGGTFDVTLLELKGRKVQVLATAGEHQLGGKDWDDEVINAVADAFEAEHGIDPREDGSVQQDLRNRCEAAKVSLSEKEKAKIFCNAYGRFFSYTLTRQHFEELTQPLLEQTRTYVDQVLEAAGIGWRDLDAVLPVGGSSRMPQVRRMLAELSGRQPEDTMDPELAVARGATYYAALTYEERGLRVVVRKPDGKERKRAAAPATMEDVPMILGSAPLGMRKPPPNPDDLPFAVARERAPHEEHEPSTEPKRAPQASPESAPAARAERPTGREPSGRRPRPSGRQARPTGRRPRPTGRSARPAGGPQRPTGRRARPTADRPRPTGRPVRPSGRHAPPADLGAPRSGQPAQPTGEKARATGRRPRPTGRRARPSGRLARREGRRPVRPTARRRPVRRPRPAARQGAGFQVLPDESDAARIETPPTSAPATPQVEPAQALPTAEDAPAKDFAGLQGWGPAAAPAQAEPAAEPPEVAQPEPAAPDPAAEVPEFDPFAPEPVESPAAGVDAPAFEDPWAADPFAAAPDAPGFEHAAGTNPFADPPTADAPGFEHAAGTNPFADPPAGEAAAPAFEDPWASDPFAGSPATGAATGAAPAFVDPWAADASAAAAPAPQQSAEAGSSFGFLELLDMEQSGQRAIVDVNSRALAVLVHRDGQPRARVMIPGNSPLPVTAKNVFHTYFDNQPGVRVVVLEGDSEDPEECARVGECLIMGLPLRPKGQAIEILYCYDTNGRISVHARDVESGVQARVEFQR